MKKSILLAVLMALSMLLNKVSANGVAIVDAKNGIYLKCLSSVVEATVEDQISITKSTQTFLNTQDTQVSIKYGFPIPNEASAVGLRWKIAGIWYTASINASPQDTTIIQQNNTHPNLKQYLDKTPLLCPIKQKVPKDSTLSVEVTYVQLLAYAMGSVSYVYPNNYSLIQKDSFQLQQLVFDLTSNRKIESIALTSHGPATVINNGNTASISFSAESKPADSNYCIQYALNTTQLGLFNFSTFLPDSLVPDSMGRGYFVSIVEPDPSSNTQVIKKVFTLIIDRSGSMSGDKIVQARNAAIFVVNNLNEGDLFNLIDFDDQITCFKEGHVPFTAENKNAALAYIAQLQARSMTNIGEVFGKAVPQFAASGDSTTANIIIFFTDGQPTAGMTNTADILNHIKTLTGQLKNKLMIFTFGIGSDVNTQLLSQIATQNNGLCEFLSTNELEKTITQFYLKIRNPVLLNTSVSFANGVISEVYPKPLPNLYKGQQMIIAGRYDAPGSATATFSGETFGKPVSYTYTSLLTGDQIMKYQFLMKIWAKRKMEYLLGIYYQQDPNSPVAKELKSEITRLCMKYSIVGPFTSFVDNGQTTSLEKVSEKKPVQKSSIRILALSQNTIQFIVENSVQCPSHVHIYNSKGQLVRTLRIMIHGKGVYSVRWDGLFENGTSAPCDVYFCVIEIQESKLCGKMVFLR